MNKMTKILIVLAIIGVGRVLYFTITKNLNTQNPQHLSNTTPTSTIENNMPAVDTTKNNLQKVSLDNRYTLQVPSGYTNIQVTPKITNIPNFEFTSGDKSMAFSIDLLPYLVSNIQVSGKTTISSDGNTIYSNSQTLANSFIASNGWKVFWNVSTDDLSVGNCTMNSVCPPPPANQRYSVTYNFVIADKANNTLVGFWASDVARISTPSVTGFLGVSKIIHDIIIPSLVSTQKISATIPSITNVFPSGSNFPINPYPYVVVSWNGTNLPIGATVQLSLLSANGSESIGLLSNTSDCSTGGDGTVSAITSSYNWTVNHLCAHWQDLEVQAGKYEIGVIVRSGNNIIANGQSNIPFEITNLR